MQLLYLELVVVIRIISFLADIAENTITELKLDGLLIHNHVHPSLVILLLTLSITRIAKAFVQIEAYFLCVFAI